MKSKLLIIGLMLAFVGCSSHYSDGYRAGIVRKFSRKGVFIKSWEGELLLGGVVQEGSGNNATLVNEIFTFSIDPLDSNEGAIAKEIEKALDAGTRVKLHYIQNNLPKIRTNTDYFIQKVEFLEKP